MPGACNATIAGTSCSFQAVVVALDRALQLDRGVRFVHAGEYHEPRQTLTNIDVLH